jgi:hypothetical protein
MTEPNPIKRLLVILLASSALFTACDDDADAIAPEPDMGAAIDQDMAVDPEPDMAVEPEPDMAVEPEPDMAVEPEPTTFQITLTNVSGDTWLPTPFAPGLARSGDAFFSPDEADRGEGLEMLAEDGNPGPLLASVGGLAFNTPVGADAPGPLFPGERYQFELEAMPEDGALHFATMVVQTNDWFIAPGVNGVELFDGEGAPLPERDISAQLSVWDAGTEGDEAPGFGHAQAPRQAQANAGPSEGVLHSHNHPTRAIPAPTQLIELTVEDTAEGFSITATNRSGDHGALMTPIAPIFFATHTDAFSVFEPGAPASDALQSLAEDGSPMALVGAHADAGGVGEAGAAAVPMGADGAGPIFPGDAYHFEIVANPDYPRLSLAAMVVQSNDAFIAAGPDGVALFEPDGSKRSAEMVHADLMRMLVVWDAGTEANQVPGAGPDQPARQAGPNVGAPDLTPGVRHYGDTANDLTGPWAGGFISVQITAAAAGGFDVRIENTSGGAFPGVLTPTLWALHGEDGALITTGEPAPAGVEALAEDGNPATWAAHLEQLGWAHGVLANPDGGDSPGPIHSGGWYAGHIMPSADAAYLSLATMVVPSNDTFIAVRGVQLLDAQGMPRPDADIAADIEASLAVYDAGTEANQYGASGGDMAPHQAEAGAGMPEGDGTVRMAGPGAPPAAALLQVTISPLL